MKILMTNNALVQREGSESYLETVATELRRLGHELTLFSPSCGPFAGTLRAHGFDVYDDVNDLPRDFDVIHGQHVSAVGLVRARFPRTPMVFVSHSWVINPLEDPVPELGAAAYVAFNQLTESRLRAHAGTAGAEIVRMTQPVSTSFGDGARVPIGDVPMRAVAVSRRMKTMPARLAAACGARGIDFEWVGGPTSQSADARTDIMDADIVFAMGRTALEAMAAARAVVVLDDGTNAGWVTNASYPDLEAGGFTGLLTGPADENLDAVLAGYDPPLGTIARRLALRHHGAKHHATSLVELYARVGDAPQGSVSHPQTIALLAAERTGLELRTVAAEWSRAQIRRELADAQSEVGRLTSELEHARAHVVNVEAELEKVRAQRDRSRMRRQKASRQRDEALQRVAETRGHCPGQADRGAQAPSKPLSSRKNSTTPTNEATTPVMAPTTMARPGVAPAPARPGSARPTTAPRSAITSSSIGMIQFSVPCPSKK